MVTTVVVVVDVAFSPPVVGAVVGAPPLVSGAPSWVEIEALGNNSDSACWSVSPMCT